MESIRAQRTPGKRVMGLMLHPISEWAAIDSESSTPREIYVHYVAPLVAIGVIAAFLSQVVIGIAVPIFGTVRVPVLPGVVHGLIVYFLSFAGVGLLGLLVNSLAPTFGGRRDSLRALRVTVYSYTPAWLAGVLRLTPPLDDFSPLIAAYGVYLLYVGLPVMMRCPKDKAAFYAVAIGGCAVAAFFAADALGVAMSGSWQLGA